MSDPSQTQLQPFSITATARTNVQGKPIATFSITGGPTYNARMRRRARSTEGPVML